MSDDDRPERTYAVVWLVDVDARSQDEAIRKARKYLNRTYAANWEPLSIDVYEPGQSEVSQ